MNDLFEQLPPATDSLRNLVSRAAQNLRDHTRRLELILSQDHKQIPIRDTAFGTDFAQFCTQLRQDTDREMAAWQQLRETLRAPNSSLPKPSSLQAKSFSLRAKTLSRAEDDLTTSYDEFARFYKKYTLTKLPVWVLMSCCEDINNLVGKILFLSREVTKKADIQ